MTLLYMTAATIGYIGNRTWAFQYQGRIWPSLVRYGAAHAVGYITNFTLLYVFADRLGYPHQAVQAVAILIVALLLFVILNVFVFRAATPKGSGA